MATRLYCKPAMSLPLLEPSSRLDKYDPVRFEPYWLQVWQDLKIAQPKGEGAPYSIVIPPPNITGTLHIGHALVNTLQDVLIRFHRMQGDKTLWLPGTDHAGIATQMVVENYLRSQGKSRQGMGQKAFIQAVWEWKAEFSGKILGQLDRMGFSLDWSRERFTLDERLSLAVKTAFKKFFDQGLIFKGYRLVNWCPIDQTALSDLEVEYKEIEGELTEIAYPIEGLDAKIVIATTRPETLLGDVAIAVHPDDERYQQYIGRIAILPLVGRKLKIIADPYVEKDFGTGALKITPGHDFNDFALAKKYNLPLISIFDDNLYISSDYPAFQGLKIKEARAAVISALKEQGYWIKTTKHMHKVGHSQRQKSIVEPKLSQQWFFKVDGLAKQVIAKMDTGEFRIIPDNQGDVLRHWLSNIEDWCISRQLWWGHKIPAYLCTACGKYLASIEARRTCEGCGSDKTEWETDVLDTWFSSGLFPFSTMGWPNTTDPDYKIFYPNSTLITAYDILFFWVARMAMMGLGLTGQLPFPEVYAHGLIRDEKGRKMSKTTGNGIDPLEIIANHGTDALRFNLCWNTSAGRDLKIGEAGILQSKIFLNKLFNAAKFLYAQKKKLNEEGSMEPTSNNTSYTLTGSEPLVNWFINNLNLGVIRAEQALQKYRFNDYSLECYQLLYNLYCDQFLELSKPILSTDKPIAREYFLALDLGMEQILRLMHPITPFITEELWQTLYPQTKKTSIALQAFRIIEEKHLFAFPQAVENFISIIDQGRALRGENDIHPQTLLVADIVCKDIELMAFVQARLPTIQNLLRLSALQILPNLPKREFAAQFIHSSFDLQLELPNKSAKEDERQKKILAQAKERVDFLHNKLKNPDFAAKAPPALVEKTQIELKEALAKLGQLQNT